MISTADDPPGEPDLRYRQCVIETTKYHNLYGLRATFAGFLWMVSWGDDGISASGEAGIMTKLCSCNIRKSNEIPAPAGLDF
jgi:hypothetical protein